MIISASRRTDIPCFYSQWFMKRLREGFVCVPNPFNAHQVARVSLAQQDVDVVVFWSKNPAPMVPHLDEISKRGLPFFFHFTLNAYPKEFEPRIPDFETITQTFIDLSRMLGKQRVIWRYDPIILSNVTDFSFHSQNFDRILERIGPHTTRLVTSFFDEYRGAKRNFIRLGQKNIFLQELDVQDAGYERLVRHMVKRAGEFGLEIFSCAEPPEMRLPELGIPAGKCIDDQYILREFGIQVDSTPDRFQREACGCVKSKDIGMYDTCQNQCVYCYAISQDSRVNANQKQHNVDSPSLLGYYDCPEGKSFPAQLPMF
ncbi:MAG TPA: DUF1848 domain-containing protein [Thermotogota bacterium]|nr:DUF1848 domain-containing protein [Thermotogota bacterium]HRW93672.1 DUF1848 domain-containing protein [Thermotogota bacterium]